MLAGAIVITSHDFPFRVDRVDLGAARAEHVDRIREDTFAQDKAVSGVVSIDVNSCNRAGTDRPVLLPKGGAETKLPAMAYRISRPAGRNGPKRILFKDGHAEAAGASPIFLGHQCAGVPRKPCWPLASE